MLTGGGAPTRLVLVDDDELFLEALAAMLDADGRFEIVGLALNGVEAVELATSRSPDVVLMDIDMPVMDGVEATRQIREQQPAMRVLLVSGSAFADRVGEALAVGALGYVSKSRAGTDLVDNILAIASLGR